MALFLHCFLFNTFWICWITLIILEIKTDISKITKSLGRMTELLPLLVQKRSRHSSAMTWLLITLLICLYSSNDVLPYSMVIWTISGQLDYWGKKKSLQQGRKWGTQCCRKPSSSCSTAHGTADILGKGSSVVFKMLWRALSCFMWPTLSTVWSQWCRNVVELISTWVYALVWMLTTWRLNFSRIRRTQCENKVDLLKQSLWENIYSFCVEKKNYPQARKQLTW